MKLNTSDVNLLRAMKKHCDRISGLTNSVRSYEEFCKDPYKPAALAWYLNQLSELARSGMGFDVRSAYGETQWFELTMLKNRVTLEYSVLDYMVIWQTAVGIVPAVSLKLSEIMGLGGVSESPA